MRNLLTPPKQVVRAIEVSESSVKQWCDYDIISKHYTAGDHRRITKSGLIEFLRDGKSELTHPEALGFPLTSGQTTRVIARVRE